MGSLHCLLILVILGLIGGIAFGQNMFVGMAFFWMGIPFFYAQSLCAIYGICKGHVVHGLLLLGALSLAIGLTCWFLPRAVENDAQRQTQEMQKQIERQMRQFSPR